MSDKVDERDKRILEAAISIATERGYNAVTRDGVAERAGVATGSVNNAYGTMEKLRDAIMVQAVERGLLAIVGQGVAERHPIACAAPQELKSRALAALAA